MIVSVCLLPLGQVPQFNRFFIQQYRYISVTDDEDTTEDSAKEEQSTGNESGDHNDRDDLTLTPAGSPATAGGDALSEGGDLTDLLLRADEELSAGSSHPILRTPRERRAGSGSTSNIRQHITGTQ